MMQLVTGCDVTPGITSLMCSGAVLPAQGTWSSTNQPDTAAAAADHVCREAVKGYGVRSGASSALVALMPQAGGDGSGDGC